MVNIYEYTDYREFLRDACEERRQESKAFSYRNFARVAGLSSPSFLKMVMDGKRGITNDTALRFADALKLKRSEKRFFLDLVQFTQARTHEEKNHFCRRLTMHKKFLAAQDLKKEQFEYFTRWHYAAIREMAVLPGFREDPAWIGQRLRPQITPAEAKSAIEVLQRLGLLTRREDGRLVQAEENIIVSDDVRSLAIANFHRAMSALAADAVTNNRAKDRNLVTMTAALSKEKFHEVRQRINEFRRELREMLSGCEDPHAVYQINLQLFHLTEVADEAERIRD